MARASAEQPEQQADCAASTPTQEAARGMLSACSHQPTPHLRALHLHLGAIHAQKHDCRGALNLIHFVCALADLVAAEADVGMCNQARAALLLPPPLRAAACCWRGAGAECRRSRADCLHASCKSVLLCCCGCLGGRKSSPAGDNTGATGWRAAGGSNKL